jgi:hypothetical protein
MLPHHYQRQLKIPWRQFLLRASSHLLRRLILQLVLRSTLTLQRRKIHYWPISPSKTNALLPLLL